MLIKENKIIINIDNTIYNCNYLKSKYKEIYPVLKSDAYGLGAVILAENFVKNNFKNFFVYHIDEGIELRKKFLNKIENIYILSPDDNDVKLFEKYNLIPIVSNFIQLNKFKNIKHGLFFNTGMNRNGFSIDENIENNENIDIIISHLACADKPECDVSRQQVENFDKIIKKYPQVKTSLYSVNAILTFDQNKYDIGRAGVCICYTEVDNNLKNNIIVKSYIQNIKDNIAKMPFGINNGLIGTLQQNYYVNINNKQYKIIKIDLNYSLIEVDNNVKLNDEVIIVKDNYNIIEEKTLYNDNTITRREIFQRMIYSKNNKKYYIVNNNTIKGKINYKKFDHINIFNYNKKIECKVLEIIKCEDGIVGYDATAEIKKGDVLVSVSGGYNDGINRYLSNNGFFEILGYKCKIIGRVSMDQTTLLLHENIKDKVKVGDKAYLVKKDNLPKHIKYKDFFYMLDKSRRVKKKY